MNGTFWSKKTALWVKWGMHPCLQKRKKKSSLSHSLSSFLYPFLAFRTCLWSTLAWHGRYYIQSKSHRPSQCTRAAGSCSKHSLLAKVWAPNVSARHRCTPDKQHAPAHTYTEGRNQFIVQNARGSQICMQATQWRTHGHTSQPAALDIIKPLQSPQQLPISLNRFPAWWGHSPATVTTATGKDNGNRKGNNQQLMKTRETDVKQQSSLVRGCQSQEQQASDWVSVLFFLQMKISKVQNTSGSAAIKENKQLYWNQSTGCCVCSTDSNISFPLNWTTAHAAFLNIWVITNTWGHCTVFYGGFLVHSNFP